jgi:hypothetical protein
MFEYACKRYNIWAGAFDGNINGHGLYIVNRAYWKLWFEGMEYGLTILKYNISYFSDRILHFAKSKIREVK